MSFKWYRERCWVTTVWLRWSKKAVANLAFNVIRLPARPHTIGIHQPITATTRHIHREPQQTKTSTGRYATHNDHCSSSYGALTAACRKQMWRRSKYLHIYAVQKYLRQTPCLGFLSNSDKPPGCWTDLSWFWSWHTTESQSITLGHLRWALEQLGLLVISSIAFRGEVMTTYCMHACRRTFNVSHWVGSTITCSS